MFTKMMQQSPETVQIPDVISRFFWEYDPHALDVVQHADLIIGRLMEHGDWAAMRWLQQSQSRNTIWNARYTH